MAGDNLKACVMRMGTVLLGRTEPSVSEVSRAAKEISIGLNLATAYEVLPDAVPAEFLDLLNKLDAGHA
jgi:hypothetical protein